MYLEWHSKHTHRRFETLSESCLQLQRIYGAAPVMFPKQPQILPTHQDLMTTGLLELSRDPTALATVYSFRNGNQTQVEPINPSPDFRALDL